MMEDKIADKDLKQGEKTDDKSMGIKTKDGNQQEEDKADDKSRKIRKKKRQIMS